MATATVPKCPYCGQASADGRCSRHGVVPVKTLKGQTTMEGVDQ